MARPGSSPARFIDAETGSEWDISGRAVTGPLTGRELKRLPMLSDYWFDRRLYHPDTAVYREWQPPAAAIPSSTPAPPPTPPAASSSTRN